jgi:hypothetical protein
VPLSTAPLIVDDTLAPKRSRRLKANETLPATNIPLATNTVQGAISGAEKVALAAVPADIANAVAAEATARTNADNAEATARSNADAAEATARSNADTAEATARANADTAEATARTNADNAEATTRANADTALDGRVDTLEGVVGALDPNAEQNAATNLATAAPNTPPEQALLFVQRNATTGELEFRPVHPGAGLQLKLVGSSIEIALRPSFYTPPRSLRRRANGYRDVRRQGQRTAGKQGDTTKLLDNHGSANLFPYMLWAGLDVYGFPHNRHKRLESDSLGNDSLELGYEFGHDVRAGDFRDGRGMIFFGRGRAENVTWSDAFWDWTLEINPTAGNFAGPYRLRLLPDDLGATWSGATVFDWRVELRSEGWKTCSAVGRWTIFGANGKPLRELSASAELSTFDFLAAAWKAQLRWRVDRDRATRLDTFDNTNQGANQGANRLRCQVRTYGLDWDGFPKD